MAAQKKSPSSPELSHDGVPDLSIAIQSGQVGDVMTARIAGTLKDLRLDVSPKSAGEPLALRNMAKAINLALQGDFLETRLEPVYAVARVRKGAVEILHRDYIGLGHGLFASIGRAARSLVLTLQGPDPSSAIRAMEEHPVTGPVRGVLDLLARKLNLVQEYEDMVPAFVEQTLDRLEAVYMVQNWHRDEWQIDTTVIGLDVVMKPVVEGTADGGGEKPRTKAARAGRKGGGKRG
ncbi:MAG: hypothetical protein IPM29_28765 [Planctomycetes bacterium]|nr:hypothetical protein [Planctomycetota bacterium]